MILLIFYDTYRNKTLSLYWWIIQFFSLHQERWYHFQQLCRYSNFRLYVYTLYTYTYIFTRIYIILLNSLSSSFSLLFFLFFIYDSFCSTAVALPGNFIPTSTPFIPLISHMRVSTYERNMPRGYAHRRRRCSPRLWLLFVFFLANSGVLHPFAVFLVHLLGQLRSAIVSPAHDGRASVCAPRRLSSTLSSLLSFFFYLFYFTRTYFLR